MLVMVFIFLKAGLKISLTPTFMLICALFKKGIFQLRVSKKKKMLRRKKPHSDLCSVPGKLVI